MSLPAKSMSKGSLPADPISGGTMSSKKVTAKQSEINTNSKLLQGSIAGNSMSNNLIPNVI